MTGIETGKELKFENLISLRRKMTQQQLQEELMKLGKFLKENNINKVGPLISATFSVENVNGEQLIDSEFLVPVDKKVSLPNGYKFKEKFHLVNVVYKRYIGNPMYIQEAYNELLQFIQQNGLQQITAAYNVNVNEEEVAEGAEPIIDIYFEINSSML
ncbi:hypothetical protein BHF71_10465 [Vulcanibacillus modesticaldus]|uniref:AraC family transcriptional regulator n=1 Tax=Vulcanibacillus modesticaldus TaxID=337097 RepID=A0A1D2YTF2_9BACI|nr:GyrI-like domain-containing protein [Vulcanibacillus modesticaldus]OEF98974.1 hypothetical protein BHF71_10465 [Vulcanibacillus modesticaldus]